MADGLGRNWLRAAAALAAVAGTGGIGFILFSNGTTNAPGGIAPDTAGFTIFGGIDGGLSPGAVRPLRLTIKNERSSAIAVTRLLVSIAAGSTRSLCDGAAQLRVRQSNLDAGDIHVTVPAHASVVLPADADAGVATAPAVEMLDLPTNQDSCKGASFTLLYQAVGSA